MIKNVSDGKQNYSQRNNKIDPLNTCAPTAMIAALDYSGYLTEFPKGIQPEDELTEFCRTNLLVLNFYKSKFPSLYKNYIDKKSGFYQPNEIHEVLSYATNLWMRKTVTEFKTNISIDEIKYQIDNNRPLVLSGVFGKLNHVVCLVGYEMINGEIKNLIIDDSYGNYLKNYSAGFSGNDIFIPIGDFIHIFKPVDGIEKFGHIII